MNRPLLAMDAVQHRMRTPRTPARGLIEANHERGMGPGVLCWGLSHCRGSE